MASIYHRLRSLNPFTDTPPHHTSSGTHYTAVHNDSGIDDEQVLRLTKLDPRRDSTIDESLDDEQQYIHEEEGEKERTWKRAWRYFMVVWNWSMNGMMWISMVLWALGYVKMEMVMPGTGKVMVVPPERMFIL